MQSPIVVMGGSAGGLEALCLLLGMINTSFPVPIVITKHLASGDENGVLRTLGRHTSKEITIAEDKEAIEEGVIYLAPSGYHLQVEEVGLLSLSMDERVNFARPSIDVLFQSAADVYGSQLVGVLLSGGSRDGVEGIKSISEAGGVTIVQSPETARVSVMPQAGINTNCVDYVMDLSKIADFIMKIK